MAVSHMIVGFRLHEAPSMGVTSAKNDPKRENSQLLGVLNFGHINLDVDFAS